MPRVKNIAKKHKLYKPIELDNQPLNKSAKKDNKKLNNEINDDIEMIVNNDQRFKKTQNKIRNILFN